MRKVDLNITFIYIIDESLGMSKGKISAQVSHVAMMLADAYPQVLGRAIVLRADHKTFVAFLDKQEIWSKENCYNTIFYIKDAGLTEVPKDTITCIGFFQTQFMRQMTKDLKLV
jgi:peptidyl-tRNA hydrolase